MKRKNKALVNATQLTQEFFEMVKQRGTFGPSEGASFGYMYGFLSGFVQQMNWSADVQAEMQRAVDEFKREQARLAVPVESI